MFFAALLSLCLISTAGSGPTADIVCVLVIVTEAVLVNGIIPGPTIKAIKGDVFNLNVIDNLTDNTTLLHLHGFFQENNSWADGYVLVSLFECNAVLLVQPLAGTTAISVRYFLESRIPETYILTATQYCDGPRGP
ncbi:hypothetical protein C8R44DRAFT_752694 [Mycena epipterygia]|nr:hypothetical protein C8R44DRAFT_752694 [Mycena epipterygia]